MPELELTPRDVRALFSYCQFAKGDEADRRLDVEGVLRDSFALHRGRLREKQRVIEELLCQLPTELHRHMGGGGPMMKAGIDVNGYQWTREEAVIERLIVLGVAIGEVKVTPPREQWKPGQRPFIIVML